MTAEFITLRDGNNQGRQLPPLGMKIPQGIDLQTPGNTPGSFSFEMGSDGGKPTRCYPRDLLTGLPFPLVDIDREYPDDHLNDTNYHHHFYYRRDPGLEGELRLTAGILTHPEKIGLPKIAGLAVRMSRGQLVKIGTHNEGHRRFGAGPVLPLTLQEKYKVVVFACAGVLSPYAVDVSRPFGDEVVEISPQQLQVIADPKTLGTEKFYWDRPADYRRRVIGSFFVRYAAGQDFSGVSEIIIDEFLHTKDRSRKVSLGKLLLKVGTQLSIEPLHKQHSEIQQAGYVQPGKPSLISTVRKRIHPESYPQAFGILIDQLKHTVAA